MKISLPLVARKEVAERTMSFAFDLEGQSFPFKPGQYVNITQAVPRYQDEKGNSRSFSIASSPEDPLLLIATRLTGSAFKRSLAEVALGTRVDVQGPMGSFVLPQDATKLMVFVAGGIGITPFRSMIQTATERKLPHQLTLIYSNRSPEGAPFLDELGIWERENPNFRLVATMTALESSSTSWHGRRGYVDGRMIREVLENPERFLFYVAGPERMVAGVAQVLIEVGVSQDMVRTEEFPGY
jgi:ferredoxin-NADP reductase